jgi:hypothetical protein
MALYFLYNGWLEEGADLMGLLPMANKYVGSQWLLYFLYNGWLEEGADLMGLLQMVDKYDIQEANCCSSFFTVAGWSRKWNTRISKMCY